MKNKENLLLAIGAAVAIVSVAVGMFFSNYTVIPIGILIGLLPYFMSIYSKYVENLEIERKFSDFLVDVKNGIKSGMTLPQAIKSTKGNNYGALTKYVKMIIAQVDWGIPFEKILYNFSKGRTENTKRMISTIIETHKGGGNISEILEYVVKASSEIQRLKDERKSELYSQVITGYVIFYVFLGIILSLHVYLLPSLSSLSQSSFRYDNMFRWLIIIQGFFSGLVVGKMSEGRIVAGLRHSLIFVLTGYVIFSLFL